jgi:hypothetical protein
MDRDYLVLRLIFVLAFGLLLNEVAAQKLKGDAVFLKSGSVVTGKIVQYDSLAGVKISNKCGIWLYQFNEIDSLGANPGVRYYTSKSKGYYNISSSGLLIGEGNTASGVLPSFTTINGYRFLPGLTSGIGVGYEYFDWSVLPVFADVRYFFVNEGFSPFLLAQGGYSFALEQNFDNNYWGNQVTKTYGGPMFGAGAGIRAGIARNSALLISLSYRFQKLSYDSQNYWELGTIRRYYTNYNRIALTVAFLFE